MGRGATLILAAVALSGCDQASPPQHHPPLIAFHRFLTYKDRDPVGIYVVQPNGAGLKRVAPLDSYYESPSWSPDGSRLAYVSLDGGLYALSFGTGRQKLITHSAAYATAWSPDGRFIATMVPTGIPESPGYPALVPADGGKPQAIGRDPPRASEDVVVGMPTWAPDGDRFAYTALGVGLIHRRIPPQSAGIYTIRRDGSDQRRVTRSGNATDVDLRWTNDGRIFFVRESGSSRTLFSVRPDGSFLEQWTRNLAVVSYDVSKDGKKVAEATPSAIYVQSSPGGPSRLLTRSRYPNSLAWSPDRRFLAFISSPRNDGLLFVVSARGGRPKQLTPRGDYDETPVWRP